MEKKSLWFFLLVFILFLSFNVSSDCEENDIMMKLSAQSKALAGLWNTSDYPVSLCYSEFFGNKYSGENPRECNGGNSLLVLQFENESNVSFYEYEKVYTIPGAIEDKGQILCEGEVRIYLDEVYGCRKGRTTNEIYLNIPVSFYASPDEKKDLIFQSNVQVRKQSNCGEFIWKYEVKCDRSGKPSVVSVNPISNPIKGENVPSGYTIIETMDPMYWNSGDSKNGYKNPVVYMNVSEYKEPNMEVKVILDGDVDGCRKGRSTKDYEVDIPIYFNGSFKEFFIQSGVAVRKQSYCNDFLWKFNVSKDASENLLVNGKPYKKNSPVKLDWKKARVDKGFTYVADLPPKFFNSGDSKNGYVNPAVYTLMPKYEAKFSQSTEDVENVIRFDVPICYGDVSCNFREDECNDGEVLLASLDKEYESKISKGDDSDYKYKICCIKDVSLDIDSYWSDMAGEEINKTDLGDTVRLIVDFDVEGMEVNYTIYKEGELSWNPFNWFTKKIEDLSFFNNYPTWVARESGKYYFTAEYVDENGNIKKIISKTDSPENPYGILEVTNKVNNSLPTVSIINPESYSDHGSGSNITFEAEFFDEDDDLNLTWVFGDENIVEKSNCLSGEDCGTSHVYSISGGGVFYPLARVTEMNRKFPNKAEHQIALLIYSDGINLFPLISEPEFGKNFENGLVTFNGNDSYIANCTTSNNCIFPQGYSENRVPKGYSENRVPKGYSENRANTDFISCYSPQDSNLKCFDYPDKIFDGGKYELYFNWTFSEGEDYYGNYSSSKSTSFNFNRLFFEEKQHSAKLKIGFESF